MAREELIDIKVDIDGDGEPDIKCSIPRRWIRMFFAGVAYVIFGKWLN